MRFVGRVRQVVATAAVVLVLSMPACTDDGRGSAQSPTQAADVPAPQEPAPTPGSPAAQSTRASPPATSTPSPIATPLAEPFVFVVDEDVPTADLELIAESLEWMREWLEEEFGGAPLLAPRIRVFGPASGMTAWEARFGQILLSTGPIWNGFSHREKIVGHEYVHILQQDLGCLPRDAESSTLPRWLLEGMAEYLGWAMTFDRGLYDTEEIGRALRTPIRALGPSFSVADEFPTHVQGRPNPPIENVYAVWALAAEELVARSSLLALRDWCALVGAGVPWEEAFEGAFGIAPEDFYVALDAVFAAER